MRDINHAISYNTLAKDLITKEEFFRLIPKAKDMIAWARNPRNELITNEEFMARFPNEIEKSIWKSVNGENCLQQ